MKALDLQRLPWHFDWKQIFQQRRRWIFFIALLLLAAAGYAGYRVLTQTEAEASASDQIQTATARRGELTVFASGAGQVVPAAEVGLGFDESGTLVEILVKVGDQVQAGQALARLETNQSEQDLALALAQAELDVLTAQQALDESYASAQMDAAEALKAVEDAEQALEDLQNSDLRQAQALQAVAEAQEVVKEAERAYNGVRSTASQSVIDAAYAELVLAEKQLKEMQGKFADYANKPDDNLEKANLQLKLSKAQAAYDTALSYYNAVSGTGSELDLERTAAELATAQAELAEAQREWERVKDGPTPGEIALAEANLEVARSKYEILKNGPDPAEIALAETNLANAQAQLAVAQEDQAVIDLVAPFEGTILSIDASVGETAGTGAIISLADLSQPLLEVYLDEGDFDKVAVGLEAEVVFDSLPDSTFTGRVTAVNPSLQTVSNVATIVAEVQLDEASYSKPLALPVGSNASVDVIGGRAENAVLVPVEALREIGPGEYAVFVIEDGEPRLRVVTVGLMDYTSAEITSGLEAGEIVTTGVVETQSGSQE
jgi:multidrug efflux pump subunit AcrA (membrane-fusion protein)